MKRDDEMGIYIYMVIITKIENKNTKIVVCRSVLIDGFSFVEIYICA